MSHNQRSSVTEDPTVWVLETYPWSQPASTPLMRLKPECSDPNDHRSCSQSALNTNLSTASSNSEDQLVSYRVYF